MIILDHLDQRLSAEFAAALRDRPGRTLGGRPRPSKARPYPSRLPAPASREEHTGRPAQSRPQFKRCGLLWALRKLSSARQCRSEYRLICRCRCAEGCAVAPPRSTPTPSPLGLALRSRQCRWHVMCCRGLQRPKFEERDGGRERGEERRKSKKKVCARVCV